MIQLNEIVLCLHDFLPVISYQTEIVKPPLMDTVSQSSLVPSPKPRPRELESLSDVRYKHQHKGKAKPGGTGDCCEACKAILSKVKKAANNNKVNMITNRTQCQS